MSKTHEITNDDEVDSNDGSIEPEIYTPPTSASHNAHQGVGGGVDEKEKRTRSRKWSDEEVDLFLKILGDSRYMFAASLENLVPKKRSNYEIFTNIRNVFRRELKELHRNRLPGFEYSMSLDLSIEKLRKKYSNLKVEWRRMSTDRVRKGQQQQVIEHFPEPRWYRSVQKLMTDIKTASQKVNNTISSSTAVSSSSYNDDNSVANINPDTVTAQGQHQVKDEMMMMMDEQPTFVVISNRQSANHHDNKPFYNNGSDAYSPRVREYPLQSSSEESTAAAAFNGIEADFATEENHHARHSPRSSNSTSNFNNNNFNNNNNNKRLSNSFPVGKPPVTRGDAESYTSSSIDYRYPYNKRQRVALNDTTALNPPSRATSSRNINELANGLKQLAELQMKRQRMIIEADFKTYELFLRHKEQETEKNRAHELRLAEIYAQALSGAETDTQTRHSSPPLPSMARQRHYDHHSFAAASEPPPPSQAAYKTISEVEREMTSPSFSPAHSFNGSYRSGGDQS